MVSYVLSLVVLLALSHAQRIAAAECGENERVSDCAREVSCQPSCDVPDGKVCPRMCALSACECADGHVRDHDMKCVPKGSCHARPARAAPECEPNEVERQCAPALSCQPTCNQAEDRVCPRMCSPRPCVCKENYVRASRTNRTCIPQTECQEAEVEQTCGENEEYALCVGHCQPSCENKEQKPCLFSECMGGYVCKEGFFRENSNVTSACIKCDAE